MLPEQPALLPPLLIFTVRDPSLSSADSFTCSAYKQQVAALSFATQVRQVWQKKEKISAEKARKNNPEN